jgi:hypothetical protein
MNVRRCFRGEEKERMFRTCASCVRALLDAKQIIQVVPFFNITRYSYDFVNNKYVTVDMVGKGYRTT